MKRARSSKRGRSRLLDWVLCRRGQAVSCAVDCTNDTYRLSISTIGRNETPIERTFTAGLRAIQGHAAVVQQLRNSGWTLVAYR